LVFNDGEWQLEGIYEPPAVLDIRWLDLHPVNIQRHIIIRSYNERRACWSVFIGRVEEFVADDALLS
jgi:hypothetical protein